MGQSAGQSPFYIVSRIKIWPRYVTYHTPNTYLNCCLVFHIDEATDHKNAGGHSQVATPHPIHC
jgi:hypothetical protein